MTAPVSRISRLLGDDQPRPLLLGEYPYYRAAPRNWRRNLHELAELGIDVVTMYVPWRFHEVGDGAGYRWDFDGDTYPQRNLHEVLRLVAEAGLTTVLKPGPFVHGEVQIGGLPDRVCHAPGAAPVADVAGTIMRSQQRPLPSLFSAAFRDAVAEWLTAVSETVLKPHLRPAGPVVALQLGNEGLYSDAALPVTAHDFSAPGLAAFRSWLTDHDHAELAGEAGSAPASWSDQLRQAWSQWSGQSIAEILRRLAGHLPSEVPHLFNLPLAETAAGPEASAGWLVRADHLGRAELATVGYTSWVGNAARDPTALRAHLAQIRLAGADNLETNWGFTWTEDAYAEPGTPLFHALLALALGSTTVSVYTACATRHWHDVIDLDPAALRAEGIDPALFGPPYCPGAPLDEEHGQQANAVGVRMLRDLFRWHGTLLDSVDYAPDLTIYLDPELIQADAWPADGRSASNHVRQVGDLVGELAAYGRQADLTASLSEAARLPAERPLIALADPDRAGVQPLLRGRVADGRPTLLMSPHPSTQSLAGLLQLPVDAAAADVLARLGTDVDRIDPQRPGFSLRHRGADAAAEAVFAFNPGTAVAVVEGMVGAEPYRVRLGPGGAVVVLGSATGATGALCSLGPAAEPDQGLEVGGLVISAPDGRYSVARRTPGGWRVRRYDSATPPAD